MERPDAKTTAYFDAAVPEDSRAVRGQMFGHPCAYVNGNMFFGTFAQSVLIRVGETRAKALAKGALRVFLTPRGRTWKEYLQVDTGGVAAAKLAALAREALAFTVTLPAKPPRTAKPARAPKPVKTSRPVTPVARGTVANAGLAKPKRKKRGG